ncbi:hypothetical protein J1N35_018026 [Gossypium stocksii]|uniref:Uncharacterized protein n=1 Tax=Gossypium stocksii TaxID=47602 RepID=A0A9D3VNJ0_9ROSI|nr:hypothetical protein J1N35_018026 [Gossypium stocksii]
MTYDSFNIKGAHILEAMVQTHLASGSPYLELYVKFSSPNKAFVTLTSTIVREEYMTPTRHSISGRQNIKAPVFGNRCYETSTRRDGIRSTTSTSDGTSYVTDDGELDDESDVDPPREPGPMVQKLYYFLNQNLFQPNLKMLKGVQMKKKKIYDSGRTRFQPTCIMADDALEFLDLPHKRCDHTSS